MTQDTEIAEKSEKGWKSRKRRWFPAHPDDTEDGRNETGCQNYEGDKKENDEIRILVLFP
jgi:hypothetical protein